jgi:hypothetical protein
VRAFGPAARRAGLVRYRSECGEYGAQHAIVKEPNQITSLDAAMTLLFHIEGPCRGAGEFLR